MLRVCSQAVHLWCKLWQTGWFVSLTATRLQASPQQCDCENQEMKRRWFCSLGPRSCKHLSLKTCEKYSDKVVAESTLAAVLLHVRLIQVPYVSVKNPHLVNIPQLSKLNTGSSYGMSSVFASLTFAGRSTGEPLQLQLELCAGNVHQKDRSADKAQKQSNASRVKVWPNVIS